MAMTADRYDEATVVCLQSYWRGCIQRRHIHKRLVERRSRVQEKYRIADVLESVLTIQRAIRNFKGRRETKGLIQQRREKRSEERFRTREDHVTCPLPNSNSVNEIFSCLADVPESMLKFSIPPRQEEIEKLFVSIAFKTRGNGEGKEVVPLVPERLLRELFFMCGGECAVMPGETISSACRRQLAIVLSQEGARIPPQHVDINLTLDQFGRYILLLQKM